ncbi:MAG: hypothetical protein MO846_05355 [Candidatus Devosia symbiotica]|nr:hypothetical protein [Candidatus Devosia symbiotica]
MCTAGMAICVSASRLRGQLEAARRVILLTYVVALVIVGAGVTVSVKMGALSTNWISDPLGYIQLAIVALLIGLLVLRYQAW